MPHLAYPYGFTSKGQHPKAMSTQTFIQSETGHERTTQPSSDSMSPPGLPAYKLLYRVDEAAHLLSISRSRIFELLRCGRLRSVTHGRTRLIPHAALEDFVRDLEDSS